MPNPQDTVRWLPGVENEIPRLQQHASATTSFFRRQSCRGASDARVARVCLHGPTNPLHSPHPRPLPTASRGEGSGEAAHRSSTFLPLCRWRRRSKRSVRAVAGRFLAAALAGAEGDLAGRRSLVLDRRKFRALVRAVAERLLLGAPAGAPPIALA